jgi:hypothetical protein
MSRFTNYYFYNVRHNPQKVHCCSTGPWITKVKHYSSNTFQSDGTQVLQVDVSCDGMEVVMADFKRSGLVDNKYFPII